MTEYDYSPEAYERYLATQQRIARWVDNTEAHSHDFRSPGVPPLSTAMTGRTAKAGTARTRRTSFGTATTRSRKTSIAAPTMTQRTAYPGQPTTYAEVPGPMPSRTNAPPNTSKTARSRRHSLSATNRSRTFYDASSGDDSTLYSPSEYMAAKTQKSASKYSRAGPSAVAPTYMYQTPPPSPLASPMPSSASFPFPSVSQAYSYPYVVPPPQYYGTGQPQRSVVIVPPKGKSLKVYYI